jgi:hypothetical protein
MKINNETELMLEYCTDALTSYDNYGDPMCAGLAHIVCVEMIANLMDGQPGVYDFLEESLRYPCPVDWEHIATTVNQIKGN